MLKQSEKELIEYWVRVGWHKAPFLPSHWYAPAGYLRGFTIMMPKDIKNWLENVIEGKWRQIDRYLVFEREEDCKIFIMTWN